jgi:hypothetical protein
MLRAVWRNGIFTPVEPLPPECEEGAPLEVAKVDAAQVDIDAWAKSMNELCADSAAEDEDAMRRAIEEHRRQAKAQTRRDMGLSA